MIYTVKKAGKGSIDAWFPRGLVCNGLDVLSAHVSNEGLCALRISWDLGKITKLEVVEDYHESCSNLLLPRLVEPHAHIDKGFTWKQFPNFNGTYSGALEANLREHQVRTFEKVRLRGEKALRLALKNGIRSLRSHVDSFGKIGQMSWEVLNALKLEWQDLIELQCVALVPIEYWSSNEGCELATKVANEGGLLGGVLVPPFEKKKSYSALFNLIRLANKLNCGVDLHIDESGKSPAAGIKELIGVLDNIENKIPITCSHSSSMGLLPPRQLKYLANKLASLNINVVALPLANSWLLGRKERHSPLERPMAPIKQLQQAGVTVAVGGDNIQDPWFPLGNLDPIALMSASMPLIQLPPWERLGLSLYTTSAANLMGLKWDGTIKLGSPADFLVLKARTWTEALSTLPGRQQIINGNWFDNDMNHIQVNNEIFDQ